MLQNQQDVCSLVWEKQNKQKAVLFVPSPVDLTLEALKFVAFLADYLVMSDRCMKPGSDTDSACA